MPSLHHATILEMNVDSYRRRAAADLVADNLDNRTTTTSDSLADNHDHPDSDSDSDSLTHKTKEDSTI